MPGMTMNEALQTVRLEYSEKSEREILYELVAGQRIQNGSISDLMEDMYGDASRQIVGVKARSVQNERLVERARTSLWTLVSVISLFGIANIVTLLTIARSIK